MDLSAPTQVLTLMPRGTQRMAKHPWRLLLLNQRLQPLSGHR